VREIDRYRATCLSAPGDARLDVVELDVVGVVGLDVGGETVEGALDGLLGRAVHHAGLRVLVYRIVLRE
jgi:peptide deformylase